MSPAVAHTARLAYVAQCPTRHLTVILAGAYARRAAGGDEWGRERALIRAVHAEMDRRKEQGS